MEAVRALMKRKDELEAEIESLVTQLKQVMGTCGIINLAKWLFCVCDFFIFFSSFNFNTIHVY